LALDSDKSGWVTTDFDVVVITLCLVE
jgi:hypothetical protein